MYRLKTGARFFFIYPFIPPHTPLVKFANSGVYICCIIGKTKIDDREEARQCFVSKKD